MCHSGSDFLSSACVCPVSGCARICTGSSSGVTYAHPHAHMTDRPASCVHAAAGRCSLHVVRCTPRHWRRITGTGLWGHCSLPRCAHHPPARPVGRRASRELQHILVLERLRKNINHPRQSQERKRCHGVNGASISSLRCVTYTTAGDSASSASEASVSRSRSRLCPYQQHTQSYRVGQAGRTRPAWGKAAERPCVGSSRRSSLGRLTRARQSSTSFCWPCERWKKVWLTRPAYRICQ